MKSRKLYGGRLIGIIILIIAIIIMVHGSHLAECTDGTPDESGLGVLALIGLGVSLVTGNFRYIG